jgi:hypothetical protein
MYPLRYHSIIEKDWFSRSKDFQILNIASELMRASSWIEKNKPGLVNACYDRALELIDLTKSDPRWKSGLKELSRGREYLASLRWASVKDRDANNLLRSCLILLNADACNKLRNCGIRRPQTGKN